MLEGFHVVQANIARRRAAADESVMAGSTERPGSPTRLAEASPEASTLCERFGAPE